MTEKMEHAGSANCTWMHGATQARTRSSTLPRGQRMVESASVSDQGLNRRLRVLALAFLPGLRLARIAGMTLDDVIELVTLAYFEEHQQAGLSWTALERRLGRSRRTIASLSKRFSESGFAIDGSEIFKTQRDIVEALAERDLTRGELKKRLSAHEHFDAALEALIDASLVTKTSQAIQLNASLVDQVGESFEERLDGLRHFMETVAQAAHQRFFAQSAQEAIARTVGFLSSGAQRTALGHVLLENIITAVTAVDADAGAAEREETVVIFSILARPKTPAWKRKG